MPLGRKGTEGGRLSLPGGLWGGDTFVRSAETPGVSRWRGLTGPRTVEEELRRGCGNPECSAAWAKPWKSRRRPVFEERWGCGGRCLEAMVRAAVRRERGHGAGREAHRHRVPLGLVMLAQGWITHPQLRRALEEQRSAGVGRIGEWLQHECGVPMDTVTRGLSLQWSCPVLTTEAFEPQVMARVLPLRFVEEFGVLPLRIAGDRLLYLAFEDQLDAGMSFSLQQMTGLKVESGLLEREALEAARQRLLGCDFVPATLERMRDAEELTARIASLLRERQPIGARLVRVHQYYWLRTWLEVGAQSGSGTVPESVEDVFDTVFTVGAQA